MTTVFGIGETVYWSESPTYPTDMLYGVVNGVLPSGRAVRILGDDNYLHVVDSVNVTKIDTFEVGDIVSVNGHHGIVERVNNSWRELTVDFEIGSSGTTSRTVRQYRAQKVA